MLFHGHSAHKLFASVTDNTRLVFNRSQRREERKQHSISKPTEKTIAIDVETFHCEALDLQIRLPVPRLSQCSNTAIPISKFTRSRDLLVAAHTKYRYTAEPWLTSDPRSAKRFAKEMESVKLTFPGIDDDSTTLGMAAWFSVLCKVDDLVEEMDPAVARHVLQNARNTILKDPETNLGDYIDVNENSSSASKIDHILGTLAVHLKTLLPATVYAAFLEDIVKVIAGMMAETLFRESPPPNLDSYMTIRTRTIGVAPFITLVEGSLNHGCIANESSKTIRDLKNLLSEIIGLQNDLIGLDKDLSVGWPMNTVVVMQGLRLNLSDIGEADSLNLKESLKEVESMHAEAVDQAVKKWKDIHASSDAGYEKELSDIIMTFIERYLKWSMACQRYKTGEC